jgi:VanZ family protein
MTIIFALSAQSQLPSPEERWLDFVIEKSAHFAEYVILAALLVRALDPLRVGRRRAFVIAVLIAWLYALSDEFHQLFVPGRAADWSDILVDWMGAVVGAWLGSWYWADRRSPISYEEL